MLPDYWTARQVPDKKLFVAAGSTATIPLYKQHIHVAGGSPPTSCILPNVNEAEGRKFIFLATTVPATTGAAVSIDYSNGFATTLVTTISTTGVEVSFESAGGDWIILR